MVNTYARAIAAGEFVDGSACSDCVFLVAYAQKPTDYDYPREWPTERKHALEHALAEYDITLGHVHGGEYAARDCFHHGQPCQEDCECERTEFSWRPCSVCGSALGGYRHAVIMVSRATLAAE